jgi:hypothetical protein
VCCCITVWRNRDEFPVSPPNKHGFECFYSFITTDKVRQQRESNDQQISNEWRPEVTAETEQEPAQS